MNHAVNMTGITMQFPKVRANDNVDFAVRKEEIHALVGENGAGKTTLMNILYGLYQPTSGKIEVHGKECIFHSAIDAIRAGIGMVHQHFMLIPRLSIADNIVLGGEPRSGFRYDRSEAIRKVSSLCAQYDMGLDCEEIVGKKSLGIQQRTEIMKALYRKADILILDEPTAVLTPQEIDELGNMLKHLKEMGNTIIIITHKLQEVIDFSDRVTVMRQGKIEGTVNTADSNVEELTRMMVGRSVHLGGNKQDVPLKNVMLEVKELSYHDGRTEKLKDFSLRVHCGEIVGIAGIDNSGQKELTEIIAGVKKPSAGQVFLAGKDITGSPVRNIKEQGVGFIPQDRRKDGLVLTMTVKENLMLGYQNSGIFKKGIFLNDKGINQNAVDQIGQFDIRPWNRDAIAETLSGGNQQKVVVAREVSHSSKLIIADQPSRGVDIGAIELIHDTLVKARNQGQAVLLVSLELDEVMMLSDRIAVIHDGKLQGILDAATATREEIGWLMAGGAKE